ncbi:hypothetical protein [Sinobaca sp. H24]|nr:hypothetical protein [Sinobaca sp. H24]
MKKHWVTTMLFGTAVLLARCGDQQTPEEEPVEDTESAVEIEENA